MAWHDYDCGVAGGFPHDSLLCEDEGFASLADIPLEHENHNIIKMLSEQVEALTEALRLCTETGIVVNGSEKWIRAYWNAKKVLAKYD